MPPPLLLLPLLLLLPIAYSQPQPVLLGQLTTLAHDVSGTVFALNSRQLRITNFNYDGQGPSTFFWTGQLPVSSAGSVVPYRNCTSPDDLPGFSDATVELELPDGLELSDVQYISVWCALADQDFGSLVITQEMLEGVERLERAECESGGVFPVQSGWNCEPLNEGFQVRWKVEGDDLDIELVASVDQGMYMGFGVSGRDNSTYMINSDVVIAYQVGDSFAAVDYFMSDRQPCNQGVGVCPDTVLRPTAGTDDVSAVSGEAAEGLLAVRYTRPLAPADSVADRPVSTSGITFVSWAIGPLTRMDPVVPLFHGLGVNFPQVNVSIEFGREISDNCPVLMGGEEEETVPGFLRPSISNVTEITARIGPPGGSRGYRGISGGPGWGFAWYMSPTGSRGEDVLIPAIAVERGKTYRFSVQGGINDGTETPYHPLYITDSSEGGYQQRTPAQRGQETVFAGVADIELDESGGVTGFRPTANGPLCNIETSFEGDTAEVRTWEEYASTLDVSCADDEAIQEGAGILEWTVPMDAPNLLYYQCITHPFLGWKLVVFDEGAVDEVRLALESGGGSLDSECVVMFKGEERRFGGCELGLPGGLDVYWTVREEDGEIDTLFRAETNGGYVGWGWGYSQMVGSNAAIVFEGPNGAEIRDYFLQQRSTAGVQPNDNQMLSNMDAELNNGFVAGVFTRRLEGGGLPTLSADGMVDAIWARGARPGSATSLQQHAMGSRGILRLDLSGSGPVEEVGGLDGYFTAHAVLMIVGWLVLTPVAVLFMRYLKGWNPKTFYLHRGLNVLSVVVVLTAYVMGLARGSRTQVAHLVLGTVAIALALSQVVSGTLRPAKTSRLRGKFNFGHAVVGYTALHVAMANALVGILLFDAGDGYIVGWGILVGVYVLGHVLLTVFKGKVPSEDATAVKEAGEE